MKKIFLFVTLFAILWQGIPVTVTGMGVSGNSPAGSSINNERREKNNLFDEEKDEEGANNGARHFRGHWSGIEFGFNNYSHDGSTVLPDEISYMYLRTGKSFCYNFNPGQVNIGFSRHAGIVSGIGINWNNYRFEENNSIRIGADGKIEELVIPSATPVKKSRFGAIYINIPVLLEVQIPAGYGSRVSLSGGVIGGIKIGSWTKVIFEDGKSKLNGDYNLNLLRAGFTARVGYENFMVFGTYYFTPWFQETKGPNGYNLEPFEIGLALTFND